MHLRMAALSKKEAGITLKKNSSAVARLSLVQGPVEYINVGEDATGDGFWGDHVSRAGTSVRILALIAICVSVSVIFVGW